MVSIYKVEKDYDGNDIVTFFGLSSDTRPTGEYRDLHLANGSKYIEINSNAEYVYDAENKQWF